MKKPKPVSDRCCQNPDYPLHGVFNEGNIIRHSFYTTSQGRRRRYRCKACGKTFCSTNGTPYYRLHNRRAVFDEVIKMSVHGIGNSAISRIKKLAWGTVARWLELASAAASRFNDRMLKSFEIHELQADEIRTFVNRKTRVFWVLTSLEVWSRLRVSAVVGRRSLRNIKKVISETIQRGQIKKQFLFTTDGFEMYEWAVKRLLFGVCIYGQVIKKRRDNRVVRVDRRLIIGTSIQRERALFNSWDSSTLNTSFIERHNLTVRQGSAYLNRKTPSHARRLRLLEGQVALLMTCYNFVRPHQALKFGNEVRTPAMQAGLVRRRLSFRDIFMSQVSLYWFVLILFAVRQRKLYSKNTFCDQVYLWGGLVTVPWISTRNYTYIILRCKPHGPGRSPLFAYT